MTAFDVRFFGQFRILRDGAEITPVSPQVATAFKVLTLHGPAVHPDVFAELLWPGEPHTVIRKRLRNLMVRVRHETGATIEGRRDAVILHDPVEHDLAKFFENAARALAGTDGREPSALTSLQMVLAWSGPPLDDHRHESWATEMRRRAIELHARLWRSIGPQPQPPPPPDDDDDDDDPTSAVDDEDS